MWPNHERPWFGSFVYSQARSLLNLGVEVDVLLIRGYSSHREYLRAAGRMIGRNLDGHHDLVHAHYGHSAMVARLDLRRPLVVSYCGDDLLGTPSPGRPNHMTPGSQALAGAFAQVAHVARATITKSQEMELKLPRRVQSRNHVIPNGVDLDMFRRTDQAAARGQLGWDSEEKVVLFVGNTSVERKNFALAERAYQRAATRCPGLRLRVATEVRPEEMPIWMSAADVLIHPSWSEGSPNVVKEAMACELPIVATPAGDVPERLRGVVGCHVLEPDERAFADALLDSITHGRCAPARSAVSDLSLERVARRIVGVYESVIG